MNRVRIVGTLAMVVAGLGGLTQAHGDPIQTQMTYTTSGTIGTSGVNGTGSVSFVGVNDGTLTTGTKFDLGLFVVSSAQTDQAVDVAKHVNGVKDVKNDLRLKTATE